MRRLNRIFDVLLFRATAVSAMLFFAVVMASIVARLIPGAHFHSAVELSRLFFVWSCFLAAVLGYRLRAHVGFTLLFDRTSPRLQKTFTLLTHTLIFAFLAVVLYKSILTCRLLWPTVLPILGISQAWFYIPVPVCCMVMLCYAAEFIMDALRPKTEDRTA
jgi:TRAP-type C4-dicarboxylate transport system permease small subunit